jgi:hypothetical protein
VGRVVWAAIVVWLLAAGCSAWDSAGSGGDRSPLQHTYTDTETARFDECVARARAREALAHGSVIGVIYHPRILARGVRADVLFMLDDIAASGEFANEEHDPSILPSAHVRVGNAVIRWWSQPTPAAREVVLGCVNDALGYTSSATPVATSQIDQTM